MEERSNKIRIHSYSKVWNMENRIYAIQNMNLPVPIKPRELLYFIVTAFIMLLMSKLMLFVQYIPVIVRYVIIPYTITQFLLKKKLDGKPPQRYFAGYIQHLLTKGEYYERLQPQTQAQSEKIKLQWLCSSRTA